MSYYDCYGNLVEPCEISGAEVPAKCCENCKHWFTFICLSLEIVEYQVLEGGEKWDTKKDFCSRFGLKESEE